MHLSNTYFVLSSLLSQTEKRICKHNKIIFQLPFCCKLEFATKYIYRQKCVSKYEPREYDHFPGQPLSLSLCSGLTLDVLGDRRERG